MCMGAMGARRIKNTFSWLPAVLASSLVSDAGTWQRPGAHARTLQPMHRTAHREKQASGGSWAENGGGDTQNPVRQVGRECFCRPQALRFGATAGRGERLRVCVSYAAWGRPRGLRTTGELDPELMQRGRNDSAATGHKRKPGWRGAAVGGPAVGADMAMRVCVALQPAQPGPRQRSGEIRRSLGSGLGRSGGEANAPKKKGPPCTSQRLAFSPSKDSQLLSTADGLVALKACLCCGARAPEAACLSQSHLLHLVASVLLLALTQLNTPICRYSLAHPWQQFLPSTCSRVSPLTRELR